MKPRDPTFSENLFPGKCESEGRRGLRQMSQSGGLPGPSLIGLPAHMAILCRSVRAHYY